LTVQEELQQRLREARLRAKYEQEFPYEEPRSAEVTWVPRNGLEVSGGLPSLGKRR
jgi:hypothetical protein